MKRKKTTLKQLADLAGVSVTAVSKVINQKDIRISEHKRQEILRLAKKYHYTPNRIAQSLVMQQSGIFALIVPDIENPFFSRLAKYLEWLGRKHNFTLMIMNSDDNAQSDLELLDLVISQSVEGFYLVPSNESFQHDMVLEKLKDTTTSFVLIDRVFEELDCAKVSFDNQFGCYQAVKYLIQSGHKKIALIAPPQEQVNGNSRLQGYIQALKESNIHVNEDYIFRGNYRFSSGYQAAKSILKTDVTAVMSCNDMMTLGFIKGLYREGKEIPKDLSVVSYDNILELFSPGRKITSVAQDVQLLAEKAFALMQEQIDHQPPRTMILQPELIIYDSVLKREEAFLD